MNKFRFALKYLRYYFTAKSAHGVHSPFIYELLTEVISDTTPYYIFNPIEILRRQLLNDPRTIEITDFGAGSAINPSRKRRVPDIARHSAKPPKYGQLLFRLVNRFKPETILELGTSLGFGTLYLGGASASGRIITLEGCPATAAIARENFRKLRLRHIELMEGSFENTLLPSLEKLGKAGFIFFDGHHTYEATLNYFRACLPFAHADSVFVFDDIHWSDEMEKAWEEIRKHPQVKVTVDLFFIGIVFFRTEQEKEHFVIRY